MTFNWEMIRDDDYLCRMPNEIMLRVEKMHKNNWWWCAGRVADYDVDEFAKTKEEAMNLAEQWYKITYCSPEM